MLMETYPDIVQMICVPYTSNTKVLPERRELDTAERAELKQASERAWACLPGNYQWLKDWEYV